jgi:hypothetical protein
MYRTMNTFRIHPSYLKQFNLVFLTHFKAIHIYLSLFLELPFLKILSNLIHLN